MINLLKDYLNVYFIFIICSYNKCILYILYLDKELITTCKKTRT